MGWGTPALGLDHMIAKASEQIPAKCTITRKIVTHNNRVEKISACANRRHLSQCATGVKSYDRI